MYAHTTTIHTALYSLGWTTYYNVIIMHFNMYIV